MSIENGIKSANSKKEENTNSNDNKSEENLKRRNDIFKS
jgi:hypothetical protein